MSVTWHGVDEFLSGLDEFAVDVSRLAELAEAGDVVAAGAVDGAPRLTGELAGSVTSRVVDGAVYVFATAPHSAPIIVGVPSRNIEPHPFIEAALAAREGLVVAVLEQGVTEAIDRAGL